MVERVTIICLQRMQKYKKNIERQSDNLNHHNLLNSRLNYFKSCNVRVQSYPLRVQELENSFSNSFLVSIKAIVITAPFPQLQKEKTSSLQTESNSG